MSKISTYEVVPIPKLADKLIGTSVGGEIEDVTYNFTLLELLQLFIPNIPANNLQGVLDYGNTATQNINLFGKITTTNIEVTNVAELYKTYLSEEVHVEGKLFDSSDSIGLPGDFLISTGTGVSWYTMPVVIPTLQQVLTSGDVADVDIILNANLEAFDVNTDTATINDNLYILGLLTDGFSSSGTNGQVLSSTGTGIKWVNLPTYSAASPLLFNSISGVFSIQVANSVQSGYLSSSDWINFDGKQNAGNYITALTGEATATGPGSVPITLNNSAVISKILTGLNIMGGSIIATDSILTAFGKLQNQINGLVGGVQYQGTWNANINFPILTSSIGVQGHYYVVNVAGSTNLNGISDWKVGDWAIFNGGTWQKVDNTDAVTSVNGFTGAVSLISDNIPEGITNLYFTNNRARNAISAASPLLYNNITGIFTIQQGNGSQDGYISSLDWTTFNSKQNALLGNGLVKSVGGTISYITDNSANWDTAYDNSIVSAAVTGTTTKTLTLNQQDGGTISASWTDLGLTSVGVSMPSAFNVTNSPLTSNGTIAITGAGIASQYIRGDGTLANFPTNGGGGGASVSYYLNGSVNQGTFVGNTYYEMSKTPILGAGTDFNISTDGYVAQFITDAGVPALLNIPAGNWTFELFFSASSGGGTPSYYVELYKYDGVVFTLIASDAVNPKGITGGTAIDLYITVLAVPQTTLTLTDRLAIRVYIATSGRTITLHTEGPHLCQIITTFSTGILALNGLIEQVQYFGTGSSGTDFNISSVGATHTFNIPTANVTNRGLLSSADWSTFNGKQDALTLTTTGSSGPATLVGSTLNIPQYSGTNIYNSDGTLTGNRALTLSTNSLDIVGSTTTRFFSNGRIGVGTTTDAGFQFDVNGTTRSSVYYTNFGTTSLNLLTSGTTAQTADRGIFIGSGTFNNSSIVGISIGNSAVVGTGTGNVAIGYTANASGGGIAISRLGQGAQSTNGAIAIGGNATAGVAISGSTSNSGSVAIGGTASNASAIAIGNITTASGAFSIMIGDRGTAAHTASIAIGLFATTTASRQLVIGGDDVSGTYSINDVYIGGGVQAMSGGNANSTTINASGGGNTADRNGGNITIAGGKGTGTGTPGNVSFSTSTTTTTGTTLQSLTERMRIFGGTGNVVIQNGGTFTDAGFRLDVNGTTRLNGNTTYNGFLTPTSATISYLLGISGSAGGSVLQAYTNGGASPIQSFTFGFYSTYLTSGGGLSDPTNNNFSFGLTGTKTATGLGGGTYKDFRIYTTYDFTGNANPGIVYGISYEPTATNLTNVTLIAFRNTIGNNIFNSTSGNTLIGTSTDAGYKFDVNGTARVQGAFTIATSTVNNLIFSQGGTTAGSYMRWLYNPDTTGGDKTLLYQHKVGLINGSIYIAPSSQVSNITFAPTGDANYVFGGGGLLTTGAQNTLIGRQAGNELTSGGTNVFIGMFAGRGIISGSGNIHIAVNNQVTNGDISKSIHFGGGTALTRSVTFGIGESAADYLNNVYFGIGYSAANQLGGGNRGVVLQPTTEAGKTDAAALNLVLAGARGTGTGAPGSLVFSTATATTAGTTLQSLTDRMRIFGGTGNVVIQNGGTFTDAGFQLDVNGTARVQNRLTITTSGATITSSSTQFFEVFDQFNTRNFMTGGETSGGILVGNTTLGAGSGRWVSLVHASSQSFGGLRFFSDNNQTSNVGYIGLFGNGQFRFATNNTEVTNQEAFIATVKTLHLGWRTWQTIPASAAVSIESTTQGFLPPRMTAAQRTAI
ncbi:MAG: beta strand repeat-containing protein, partial [Bacteroidota bacterium]